MGAVKLVEVLFLITGAQVAAATTTTTTTTTTSFIPGNSNCVSNIAEFTVVMTDVDDQRADFNTIVQNAMAQVLDTATNCVTIAPGAVTLPATLPGTLTRRLFGGRGRSLATAARRGVAGVFPNATNTIISLACSAQNQTLTNVICATASSGAGCSARADCNQFTTTTEMPWGLPWWGWFLVCCCLGALCSLCCLPLLAAPALGGGRKKKSPSYHDYPQQYEVVDVPGPGGPNAYGPNPYGPQYEVVDVPGPGGPSYGPNPPGPYGGPGYGPGYGGSGYGGSGYGGYY